MLTDRVDVTESEWNKADSLISPFTIGLDQYIRKQLMILIPVSLQASVKRLFPSPPTTAPPTTVDATNSSPLVFGEASTSILFSTAGTGKTRRLLDLLSNTFGMYIIAPGGSEDATSEISTLLRPVRSNASKDTLSLWESSNRAPLKFLAFDIDFLSAQFLDARRVVFQTFLTLLPAYKNPHIWMQLQINCSPRFDPFDLAWRLARFCSRGVYIGEQVDPLHGHLIWCIDEVQVALENRIGEILLQDIWWLIIPSGERSESKVILSGTALRLKALKEVIEPWAEPYETLYSGPENLEPTYSIITKFPKIDDISLFWNLYQQHIQGIAEEIIEIHRGDPGLQSAAGRPLRTRAGRPLGFDLDLTNLGALQLLLRINDQQEKTQLEVQDAYLTNIHTAINSHCSMFFGRYRWSTLFIEQILKQAVVSTEECGTLVQVSVANAATDAVEAIEKALQTQLARIKDKEWANELYWMAIRATVFSQSSVITNRSAQLVSEGFTMVEELQVANDGTSNDRGPDL